MKQKTKNKKQEIGEQSAVGNLKLETRNLKQFNHEIK